MERAIPQWCGGCKQARTIDCTRTGCPTAMRLAEEAHYAEINAELLEVAELLAGFAVAAATLDFNEDRNVTWAAIVATKARAVISKAKLKGAPDGPAS